MAIIYKIHYDNVGKAYIGSSVSENPNYWGSMSARGQTRIRDDHARAGVPIKRRREILWQGPHDPTTLRKREFALITAHRTNVPTHGYNLNPMLPGVNIALKLDWDPPGGVIATATCPWGMYRVHCVGEPEFWAEFTDLDGNMEEKYRGKSKDKAWKTCQAHKAEMLTALGLGI